MSSPDALLPSVGSREPSNALNVAIVLFEDVEVLDFAGPYEVFSVAGNEMPRRPDPPFVTYTVGLTEQVVGTVGGLRVTPRYSIGNCPASDVLLVPGGNGSRRLLGHDRFLQWLREQAEQARIVGSVCTGALPLAAAGLLENRRATTHHDAFDRLQALDASITLERDRRYVRDGDVWTSGGISAGIDMSLAIVREVLGDDAPVVEEMEWMWHADAGR